MATRSLVGSCLVTLAAAGAAAAQVVILGPPVIIPAPVPVVVAPPVVETETPPPQHVTAEKPSTDARQYPPGADAQPQRTPGPAIIHERHYLSPSMNVSHYLSTQPAPTYGPETRVVIRDFYITDEPPKKAATSSPPPVGTTDEKSSERSSEATTPKNSTDTALNDLLDKPKAGASSPVKVPPPGPAEANGKTSSNRSEYGPPAPANLLDAEVATMVTLASRNGGTPMADMELDFVDLTGKHPDAKGRTDGKGELQARLAPSRWQVYVVFGDNERRSLGVILVKPTAGDPFKLQF